uniref:Transmembrane protein 115-like n=1 Tax=Rhizophora mucronata TaxID=61149 RepID=A0A2P2LIW5_RHIMU
MKTHIEVRTLTTTMNFKNSLEPQTGSSSFPKTRRLKVLTTTPYIDCSI